MSKAGYLWMAGMVMAVAALASNPAWGFGLSLDNMYRELMRQEGRNPRHIRPVPSGEPPSESARKKAEKPEKKSEKTLRKKPGKKPRPAENPAPAEHSAGEKPSLPSRRKKNTTPAGLQTLTIPGREEIRARQRARTWTAVVQAVRDGDPSPRDVNRIRRRAEADHPPAVEILAWMYTKGIGVRQDLGEAYRLYVRAARLGVEGAVENANRLYKSMATHQRRSLPVF